MEEIDKIKQQLESLIDDNATKEQIEKIAIISDNLQSIQDKTSKQQDEYTSLLKDYATVVKHQAFTVNNKTAVDETPKQFGFDSFLTEFVANKNNK